ncbi:helicase-related protein [uncultured Amnibacterium sp.]|uniref:helicase-related protein n=1 Tax=uncultured Amnibacterium sp. TaxID=1631851 RepID=UPI0035CC96FF
MSAQRDEVLAGLTGFQRDAVAHVVRRFYRDEDATRRFLVADETGLGKSVVARGVIAETIDELQHDDSVDRIDIVYVCSNSDLARQNLVRLNVTGSDDIAFTSRLSLLALSSGRLAGAKEGGAKRVNLISFTPGTSFDMQGWRTGSKEERALIHALLTADPEFDAALEHASLSFFRGTVASVERLAEIVDWTRTRLAASGDQTIAEDFGRRIALNGLGERYRSALREVDGPELSPEVWRTARNLTGEFRKELAKASVAALEPDLVILDEFQRFRHLLDPDSGEAAEIAHHLFEYEAARALLLSATPYKPFTRSTDGGEDDHFADLVATLQFLAGSPSAAAPLLDRYAAYRSAILTGTGAGDEAEALRGALLKVMSRNERPVTRTVREVLPTDLLPTSSDLVGYRRLQDLAKVLDVAIPLDYWKSIPYFGSFLDGYRVERSLRHALDDPETAGPAVAAVAALPSIDEGVVHRYEPLDPGSAPLRGLVDQTVGANLWKLLWLPAAMPYLTPTGVYEGLQPLDITKRVVFSAWSATPVAISTILSYEADRHAVQGSRLIGSNVPETRRGIRTRLAWAMEGSRAAAMSTLALFWPHPLLAAQADPFRFARDQHDLVAPEEAEHLAEIALNCGSEDGQPWESYFRRPDEIRGLLTVSNLSEALSGGTEDAASDDAPGGLVEHVRVAIGMLDEEGPRDHAHVALLALHGPGNIAWRALGRLRTGDDTATSAGHWRAAAIVASGLRSLFGRVETMLLLDQLYGDDGVYWRQVLRYCSDGNLQAVLDEYAFQLDSDRGGLPLTDEALVTIARRMSAAITLRPATYRVRNTKAEGTIAMSTRFAVQYGGTRQDAEAARQPEVRNAFNSPFPPYVLASTSVGQEGIDFHWWSHSVLHWNLPPNPVDFEQREGRVDRYGGHAVRKNVAHAHWEDVLRSSDPNPWRAAFDAAARNPDPGLGEFSPHWIYPGPATIERHVPIYPLSRDRERYERLKKDMTLYRLTLGQPRQEDMLALLEERGVDVESVRAIDLRPPRISAFGDGE